MPLESVGPGPVRVALHAGAYTVGVRLTPNRASAAGIVSVTLVEAGRPVRRAHVQLAFSMLDMPMGQLTATLPALAPGVYGRPGPVLGMSGRWSVRVDVTPPGAARFSVGLVDTIGA